MATIRKRTAANGDTSYHVQVRLKGHPTETASFKRKTDADKWVQQTEAAIREGRHFKTSVSKKFTLNDAIDRYIKEVLPLRKDHKSYMAYLVFWKQALGAYAMGDITSSLISKERSKLLGSVNRFGRQIGVSTVNR